MRRPGVRIPSRPPSFKTTSSVPNSSYRGTLGLSSLPDSFPYLVIHPERHCLSAASSVNTSVTDRLDVDHYPVCRQSAKLAGTKPTSHVVARALAIWLNFLRPIRRPSVRVKG